MSCRDYNSCTRAPYGFWVAALALAGVQLFAACAGDAAGPADLVLRGGIVATVNADNTMAEAVAIDDGWIVAVGSDEEVAAFIGAETEVIELNGRLAVPGLIEGHGHYMSLGNSKTILDLNGAANWTRSWRWWRKRPPRPSRASGSAAGLAPGEMGSPAGSGGGGESDARFALGGEPGQPGASGPCVGPRGLRECGRAGGCRLRQRLRAPRGRRTCPRRERGAHRAPARDRSAPCLRGLRRIAVGSLHGGDRSAIPPRGRAGRRRGALQGHHLVPRRGDRLRHHRRAQAAGGRGRAPGPPLHHGARSVQRADGRAPRRLLHAFRGRRLPRRAFDQAPDRWRARVARGVAPGAIRGHA